MNQHDISCGLHYGESCDCSESEDSDIEMTIARAMVQGTRPEWETRGEYFVEDGNPNDGKGDSNDGE